MRHKESKSTYRNNGKPGIGTMKLIATLLLLLSVTQISLADSNDSPLPTLGDYTSGIVSPDQEYRLGRAWLRQLRAQAPTIEDPLIYDYLTHMLYLLASNSDLENPNLVLAVINSPQINAFAVPGGVIGLNAGLLMHAQSEDELAAVIAHELAHLSQRHFARGQEYNQRTQWVTAAAILASVVLMATAGSDAGMAALATTQATAIDQQLRFSRNNEREADRIGMQTLVRAGFNPQAMPGFFERLLKNSRYAGTIPPEFLLTHPVTQSRISDSKNRADTYPLKNNTQSLEFELMRIRTSVAYTREDTSAISELETNLKENKTANKEVTRYGLAYAYFRANRYDDALTTLAPLLIKRPNRITYLYTQASILMAKSDYKGAIRVLEKGLSFSPDNYPLSMAYAEALLRNNQPLPALKVVKQQQQAKPLLPNPWYIMSECYGKLGNNIGVHEARGEYYFLTGRLEKALEQLNYAQALAQEDFQLHTRIRNRLMQIKRSANDLKL
ncbi:MAG: peptidase M48 [Gammaproteobacteria bacterium]|nr:MAG: peptidase M48 [Gammaproteobacteria bacterium]